MEMIMLVTSILGGFGATFLVGILVLTPLGKNLILRRWFALVNFFPFFGALFSAYLRKFLGSRFEEVFKVDSLILERRTLDLFIAIAVGFLIFHFYKTKPKKWGYSILIFVLITLMISFDWYMHQLSHPCALGACA